MTTPITSGTATGQRGVSFIHSGGTINFARSPRYPQWNMQFVQATEKTPAGWPIVFPMITAQVPFEMTFPYMTDAELAALRTFMYTTVQAYDSFTFYSKLRNENMLVRFQQMSIKVKQIRRGVSEVTISMVRI